MHLLEECACIDTSPAPVAREAEEPIKTLEEELVNVRDGKMWKWFEDSREGVCVCVFVCVCVCVCVRVCATEEGRAP